MPFPHYLLVNGTIILTVYMLPFESTATECHHAAAIAMIVLSVNAPPSNVAVLIAVPEAAPVPHCPFLIFNQKTATYVLSPKQ